MASIGKISSVFLGAAVRGYKEKWLNRYYFFSDPEHPARVYLREKGIIRAFGAAAKRSVDKRIIFAALDRLGSDSGVMGLDGITAAQKIGYKPLGLDMSDIRQNPGEFVKRFESELKRFRHPSLK